MDGDPGATSVTPHWRDARAYDWENAGFAADVPYWEGVLARRRPARVLELACGTGRLTLPLAAAGLAGDPAFRIVGLDYSPEMVARAREKLAAADPTVAEAVTYVQGDMRGFALGQAFDLIVCGFNAFAYLHAVDDQFACLAAVREHLAPGGRFAIDLVVPHLTFLAEAQGPVPPIRLEVDTPRPAPDIARVRRTYVDRYDATTQALSTGYAHEVYFADGRQERWLDDLEWHMTFPRELELLLRLAGLTPLERYGSWDRAPFGPRSTQYAWEIGAT